MGIGPTFATVPKAREKQQLDERVAAGRGWEDNDLAFGHPTWGPRGVCAPTLVVPGPRQPPFHGSSDLSGVEGPENSTGVLRGCGCLRPLLDQDSRVRRPCIRHA